MRCPSCSQRFGFDIVNGKGLVAMEHLRSFQPAFKRTMHAVSRYLLQAVADGRMPCKSCGKLGPVEVGGPKQEVSLTLDDPLKRRFWIRGLCPHCGQVSAGFSADDAVYWSHPAIQAFIQRRPRWRNEPDLPISYQGQPAILFRLSDPIGTAQLDVIAHRQTLRVLATFEK